MSSDSNSQLLSILESARSHRVPVYGSSSLSEKEISQLQSQGNYSNDWSQVSSLGQPSSSSRDITISRIHNCGFHGRVLLGSFTATVVEGCKLPFPAGLSQSTFFGHCQLSNDCVVHGSSLSNVFVAPRASVVHCPLVSCNPNTHYGLNNKVIEVGAEAGSRAIKVFPSQDYTDMLLQAVRPERGLSAGYPLYSFTSDRLTYIGQNVHVINCSRIENCVIGDNGSIANSLLDSTVIVNFGSSGGGSFSIDSNSQIYNSILHGGCQVKSNAYLHAVYLFECAAVTEYGRLNSVILAPDATIAGGECHNSLIGPFVGFHHQSLLIACFWPFGRGNLAYAAKNGSNHTGRVNDQECWMGEGVFVGLDASIRFPFNSVHSPYSIIASGTTVHSQRVELPFSLIVNGDSHSSQDHPIAVFCPSHCSLYDLETPVSGVVTEMTSFSLVNRIKPGWVLRENSYYIERCQIKFTNRKRSWSYSTGHLLMRPYIVTLVLRAVMQLERLKTAAETAAQEKGVNVEAIRIGASIVTMRDITDGLESYRKALRRYSLYGLYGKLSSSVEKSGLAIVIDHVAVKLIESIHEVDAMVNDFSCFHVDKKFSVSLAVHQLSLFRYLYPAEDSSSSTITVSVERAERYMVELIQLERDNLLSVERSRSKDNSRGMAVIPDYQVVNEYCRTDSDAIVRALQSRIAEMEAKIVSVFERPSEQY